MSNLRKNVVYTSTVARDSNVFLMTGTDYLDSECGIIAAQTVTGLTQETSLEFFAVALYTLHFFSNRPRD